MSRYARTVLYRNGSYHSGRIDLLSGEITQYRYNRGYIPLIKAKPKTNGQNSIGDNIPGSLLHYMPPWAAIACKCMPIAYSDNKNNKQKKNTNNIYLQEFDYMHDAVQVIPSLDDILVGAGRLGVTHTRPIVSSKLLFALLKDINVIDMHTVQQYTGLSEKQCYKIAQALRVCANALDGIVDG